MFFDNECSCDIGINGSVNCPVHGQDTPTTFGGVAAARSTPSVPSGEARMLAERAIDVETIARWISNEGNGPTSGHCMSAARSAAERVWAGLRSLGIV